MIVVKKKKKQNNLLPYCLECAILYTWDTSNGEAIIGEHPHRVFLFIGLTCLLLKKFMPCNWIYQVTFHQSTHNVYQTPKKFMPCGVLFHDTCHILEYISVLKIGYQGVFVILPLMHNTITDN